MSRKGSTPQRTVLADPKHGDRPKMDPVNVARVVRLAVDVDPDTVVEFLRVAPA